MYKTILFAMLFIHINFLYALDFNSTPFRFNHYVYYEILHKVEGINPIEFNNIQIITESTQQLVFEYNGARYTARNIVQGAIYVEMPEGRKDRYLTRTVVPNLILSQYTH